MPLVRALPRNSEGRPLTQEQKRALLEKVLAMEVKEFQKMIADFSKKWQKKRHYKPDEHFTLIHLVEEVGELAEQYVSQRIRKDKFDKYNVVIEVGRDAEQD